MEVIFKEMWKHLGTPNNDTNITKKCYFCICLIGFGTWFYSKCILRKFFQNVLLPCVPIYSTKHNHYLKKIC